MNRYHVVLLSSILFAAVTSPLVADEAELPPSYPPPAVDAPILTPIGNAVNFTTTIALRAAAASGSASPVPVSVVVPPGATVKFTLPFPADKVAAVKWVRSSRLLTAETSNTLTISSASEGDAGFYTAIVTRTDAPNPVPLYFGACETIQLRVGDPHDQRLLNLSSRTVINASNPVLMSGFVISPHRSSPYASKAVLFRAVGPSLAKFGVKTPLAHPTLKIYNADGTEYDYWPAHTDVLGWINIDTSLSAATKLVGAFPLLDGAPDVAVLRDMKPGVYTVHVTSEDSGTGDVLLEIYEVPWEDVPNTPSPGT